MTPNSDAGGYAVRTSGTCAVPITTLADVLAWLVDSARAPGFAVCRIKDRMTREWDAEMSGGNRDVMLNGWLDIGGGRELIVEVQLHLRCLFELKSDLHVLYAGARVLGAMEDATAKHEGILSEEVLQRIEHGACAQSRSPPFTPPAACNESRVRRRGS